MDLKKICSIIGIVSVLAMFLWGYLGNDWGHSWISLFIGGVACAVIRLFDNSDKSDKR